MLLMVASLVLSWVRWTDCFYVFVLEGSVKVDETELNKRDGMGLWEADQIKFTGKENSEFLLMEVPMSLR